MRLIVFSVVVFFSIALFPSCSGGQVIPQVVCDYGDVVIDMAELLVQTFPNIPPEIQTYLDLARVNLQILCETEPDTAEFDEALNSLEIIKDNLRLSISRFRASLNEY